MSNPKTGAVAPRPIELTSAGMLNRCGLGLLIVLSMALSGCLSGGLGGGEALPEGALALGDGLIGQNKDVRLRGEAKSKAIDAEFQALQFAPAGRDVVWTDGSWQGQVIPTQLYRIGAQDCRGFTHTVLRNGHSWKQVGTACRSEDGAWKIVV
jgi:surface antigen